MGLLEDKQQAMQERWRGVAKERAFVRKIKRRQEKRTRPRPSRTREPRFGEPWFEGLTPNELNVLLALNEAGVDSILRGGWPDFLVKVGGHITMIEVKSGPKDTPKPHQTNMHNLLKSLGLDVVVVDGSNPLSVMELAKSLRS